MKNVGFKRLPEFIEEDFISAVELVLSNAVYPKCPIEISRVSQDEERDLGYDGVLTSLIPFYLQFKRATFHTPSFAGKTARDRASLWQDNQQGFFSFALHRDRKTNRYDQHNALHGLAQRFPAAYVAPLFYKKGALTRYKMLKAKFAWTYSDLQVYLAAAPGSPFTFSDARILHETMTITPHASISDRLPSHEYSYSKNGQVCFHSAAIRLDPGRTTLYEMLDHITMSFVESESVRRSQESPSLADARRIVRILPELFGSSWRSRSFRSMVKAYLVDLDILPAGWTGDLLAFLREKLGVVEGLLLSEAVLWNELRIVQYLARTRRA